MKERQGEQNISNGQGSISTLFLLTVMIVFSSCTLIQNRYSAFIFLGLFILTELSKLINNGFHLPLSMKFWALVGLVLFYFIELSIKGLSDYILLFFWIVTYIHIWSYEFSYVVEHYTRDIIKKFIVINIIIFLISDIAAIRVLQQYNYASRDLAGAGDAEMNAEYAAMGAAGYSYIYGSVFLVGAEIVALMQKSTKVLRAIISVSLIITIYLIFSASYSIAIFSIFIFVMLVVILRAFNRYKYISIGLVFCLGILIVVNQDAVLSFFISLGQMFNADALVIHMKEMLSASRSGDYSGLARVKLWSACIEAFRQNPLFGTDYLNMHSYFLNHLSAYGIFGLLPFAYIFMQFKDWDYYIDSSYRLAAMIVFAFIAIFNNFEGGTIPLFIFFIYPCMVYAFSDSEETYSAELDAEAQEIV